VFGLWTDEGIILGVPRRGEFGAMAELLNLEPRDAVKSLVND
jgi:hypothetical protein